MDRYGLFAPVYNLLPTDRPFYRTGRLAGLRLLRPPRGATVLDLGCGTGVNLPLLANAVGPDGFVLGLDPNPRMLAVARRRIEHASASRIGLLRADAATIEPAAVAAALAEAGRGPAIDALVATYTLSVVPDPRAVWAQATALLAPGARIAIVDVQPPASAALAPLAAVLPVVFGGSDLAVRPWRMLERVATDVEQRTLLGGHVVVTAGTLP